MRFIHISDVHLGVAPDTGRSWSSKRKQEIWDSFEKVIRTAQKQQPEFLFITGDLFHGQPLKKEIKEVDALFRLIPGTRVMLVAGNHDYLREKSYYLTYPWADNVYLFRREEIDCFEFPELGAAVYGCSYWHREIRERKYDAAFPKENDRLHILLAHGGDERHIPFAAETLVRNGFDYVAAGHIHKGGWLAEGRAVMAGSLEPTDRNDTGMHGYWMGRLTKEGAEAVFHPIRKCEYCHETYEVNADTTERAITAWVQGLLEKRPAYQYFCLTLAGTKDPEITYDLSKLRGLDRIVDIKEELKPAHDYGRLLEEHEDSILGAYIKRMQRQGTDELTERALAYGVNALLGYEL